MDITTVQLWHDNLSLYTSNLSIDASGVEKLTSPAIQLLVSLDKKLSEGENHLWVENKSSAFAEAFRDFGLLELLQKWSKEV